MAVVLILAIFATMAAPTVTRKLRDARVRELAGTVAAVYRGARQRAAGRGAAVMVRYSLGASGTAQGSFVTREAVVGTADANEPCPTLPVPSCIGADWATADASLLQHTLDVSAEARYAEIFTTFNYFTATGIPAVPVTRLDICFTPSGRAFQSDDGAATWVPMIGVPYIGVRRLEDGINQIGLERVALIPTSGAARLAF